MNDALGCISLISTYGWQTVVVPVLLFMLLKGEIHFRYPRSKLNRLENQQGEQPKQ